MILRKIASKVDGEMANVFPKRNFDIVCNFELKISMVALSFHCAFIQIALFF